MFQRRELLRVVGDATRHPSMPIEVHRAERGLKETNVIQKWILPSVSSYIRPVIFGNQW